MNIVIMKIRKKPFERKLLIHVSYICMEQKSSEKTKFKLNL